MRMGKKSLELIILAPVVVFIIFAGAGLYFLILNSVEEFTDRTIRQSFQSMADGVFGIADRTVDQLNKFGLTGSMKATRIRQVSTLIKIEDYIRKNEIGILIFASKQNQNVLRAGLPEDAAKFDFKSAGKNQNKFSLPGVGTYYLHTFKFPPWNWRITLVKDASAYGSIVAKARYFYIATGLGLILIAVFLVVYLKRVIARPIHLIVDNFHENKIPEYKGIQEFEFLSDNIGQMMVEIARNHENLEEQVRTRTSELETAHNVVTEKNQMLESVSAKLSKYLSPQIYESIFSGDQKVEIVSKRKTLTVFFSDIANFTETTDSLESETLTNLLNHYLTEMSNIALEYGATIDKYIGDAMMVFFGDPDTRGEKADAVACVTMAIAMQRRMNELLHEWRDQGLERPFQMRVGINTGYCTVGNFGSEDRMDYTIIGNEVNLSARLQSHADLGGILISNKTNSLVKDVIAVEEREPVSAKGFAHPVHCYSVLGTLEELKEEGRFIRKDDNGIKIYLDLHAQDRTKAIEAMEEVLSQLKSNDR